MDDDQPTLAIYLEQHRGLTDDELDRQYDAELAKYRARLQLEVERAAESGLAYFRALEIAVATDGGSIERSSPGQTEANDASEGSKLARSAARVAWTRELIDSLSNRVPPDVILDVTLAVSAAAEAGYLLAYHRAEPVLEEVAERTSAATNMRRRSDWREAAQAVWHDRPTLGINAVASHLIGGGLATEPQRRALIRAIGPWAPSSSASRRRKRGGVTIDDGQ